MQASKSNNKKRARRTGNKEAFARKCRQRMLTWSNPVEFVNNMYGCHPDDSGVLYFSKVFGRG